jgi:glutamyl-tRNA reductase
MSGPTVSAALRDRFETIRRAELARLRKKLRGLTEDERQSVDAITADITRAIVGFAERGLSSTEASKPAAEALVRLFGL